MLAYVLLNRSFIRIVTTRRGQVKVRYEKKAMRASTQSAALYRRGYSWDDIRTAVEQYSKQYEDF